MHMLYSHDAPHGLQIPGRDTRRCAALQEGLSLVEDVPLLLALLFAAARDEAPGKDAPDAAGVAASVAVDSHLQRD